VRTSFAFPIVICLLSTIAFGSAAAQQSTPPATPKPATTEEVLKAVREDMQASRADVMAKNLTLTADQAAKFWPLFNAYQKEQNVIMDEHMKAIQAYVKSYDTIDDASALALAKAHFDRDTRMNALRQKWLAEFQKVLPTRLAVRVMQIDRRLSLVTQIEITALIPLVH
jgi:Spy/CpxP family protein refolding chaperone